ncbi:hypothetical protein TSUD_185350 [Trifolium subterraneum]|uniref:Uncharacterized protein n=1 Tax=Trifolium subterraneum TaxID=3900 RepID=A0A2Z6NVJ3_TRISU|nr:hypothetical protein TSUD_185350 [Trifolium subterraneum]
MIHSKKYISSGALQRNSICGALPFAREVIPAANRAVESHPIRLQREREMKIGKGKKENLDGVSDDGGLCSSYYNELTPAAVRSVRFELVSDTRAKRPRLHFVLRFHLADDSYCFRVFFNC